MTYPGKEIALVAALLILLVSTAAGPALAQDDGRAMVRVAHLSSDAPKVDVRVDDEPAVSASDLAFREFSSYVPLSAGTRRIEIFAAGDTSRPLLEANVDLAAGSSYTVGIVGSLQDDSLEAVLYEQDNSAPTGDESKLRMVHVAPDVVSVDIASQDGENLFTNLGFPNASAYAEIPAGKYMIEVKPAGTDTVDFAIPEATVPARGVYSAFVVQAADGTLDVLMVSDLRATEGQEDVILLSVVGQAGIEHSDAPVPDTGGVPLAPLLLLGAILAFVSVLFAVLGRNEREGPSS